MYQPAISGSITLSSGRSFIADILLSARPKQWIKNAFVFAALIFASRLTHIDSVARALGAFVLFSALSASVYLVNDVADRQADRAHPAKAERPIASGRISAPTAVTVAAGLLVIALSASTALDYRFGALALAYAGLMMLYTLVLKHLVLIDVFTIAGGFVLRAAAGAAVIGVSISPWLYLCTILLSLFLGFGKRRQELLALEEGASMHRRNLGEYSGPLLDDLVNIVAGATIIAYSLYTFYASNVPANHAMMVTIPFVLYGVFRYLLLVHRTDLGGAPEEAVWRDRALLGDLLLWATTAAIVLQVAR